MLLIDSNRTVQLDESVEMPPMSEIVVCARIRGEPLGVSGFVHATDNVLHGAGLLASKVLTSVNDSRVLQKFANISDQSVNLKKHMTTGHFHALNNTDILLSVDNSSHSHNQTPSVHTIIPQSQLDLTQAVHQHELSESSNNRSKLAQCTNQSSGNCVTQESRDSNRSLSSSINWSQYDAMDSQKVKIAELVDEFADIFVGPDKKLSYCDLVQHEIIVDSSEAPKHY